MATNVEAVLATIRQMESGNNYTIVTSGGSDACGAYQYVTGTWQAMLHRTISAGYLPANTPFYSRACFAPKNVQDTVARYDVITFLSSVGDNVSLVPLHWYYPAAIQSWPAMANYVPPGNSISLGNYQRNWLNTYAKFAGQPMNPNQPGNPPTTNTTKIQYNYAQLEQIWIAAGGNPQKAYIAAAVATAESNGNPNAISPSNDYGLWQINIVHGAQATLDVMTNARAAVSISNNGQDWGAWCTAWVHPQGNCGHHLGAMPQPGSSAARAIRKGVKPDPNTPLNGTGAATPITPNPNAILTSAGCNNLEWFISPGGCTAAGFLDETSPAHIAAAIIDVVVGGVLNPMLTYMTGGLGMLAGGVLMLIGTWELVKDTSAGQYVKGRYDTAKGAATTAAMTAAAPETAGLASSGNRQVNTMVRSQVRQSPSVSKRAADRQARIQKQAAMRAQARKYQAQPPNTGAAAS